MALFESYERRIDKINAVLNSYGIASLEEAEKITKDAGLDVYNQIKGIQPICFENACWAYTVSYTHLDVYKRQVLYQRGQVQPDQDLLDNSRDGYETKVTQGEAVGDKVGKCRK